MKKVKYLIIGAGISGLSFAEQKKDDDYLIIERDSVPGGLAKSFRKNGFIWDVAGHFFHFHSDSTKAYYESMMTNKEQKTVQKMAKVFYSGNYIDAPFQYNIHQLRRKEFIECLTDLYYATAPKDSVSFSQFVEKKYGTSIAKKFLIPYNEKLYACNLNNLEQDSMGVFLPKLNFDMLMSFFRGLKGKTYNDVFRYPVDGCDSIISALIDQLNNNRIRLNEKAISIQIDKKILKTDKDEYSYDYLINTIPLNCFVKMIGLSENVLNYNQVLVLNLGFDKPSINKKVSWVYFPGNEIFYRVGFYNNISGTERLSIYVEIGYRSDEKIDIDNALQRTLEDLKRVRIIDNHKLDSFQPYIISPGYVHITETGKEFTKKIIREMEAQNIYMIGRYSRWQYSAMDDSIEQAMELACII